MDSMQKTIIIGGVAIVGIVIGVHQFFKQPKTDIYINLSSGDGYATMGKKKGDFTKSTGIHLQSWNGYELSVDGSGKYLLRRFGKTIESGTITQYDGGSSYVTINHI